jgi:hypothetical protein
LVGGAGTVCHSKINFPNVSVSGSTVPGAAALRGSKRAFRAKLSAAESAVEFLLLTMTTGEKVLPKASANTCTTVSGNTSESELVCGGNWMGVSSRRFASSPSTWTVDGAEIGLDATACGSPRSANYKPI